MKGITGIKGSESIAYDMCPNHQCPHCFGRALAPEERAKYQGQRCLLCGAPRYHKVNAVIRSNKECALPIVLLLMSLIDGVSNWSENLRMLRETMIPH